MYAVLDDICSKCQRGTSLITQVNNNNNEFDERQKVNKIEKRPRQCSTGFFFFIILGHEYRVSDNQGR